ncbi:hypothetical protein [Rhodococcus daqingensis]|uniref:Uncharacterized protein n=1 Tax=Rhodococcus daqingensis TaxID=2479363 RepID=A0ABW2S3N6_9NOCA
MSITLEQARSNTGARVAYTSPETRHVAGFGVITGIGDRGLVLVRYGLTGDGPEHLTHPDNLSLVGAKP